MKKREYILTLFTILFISACSKTYYISREGNNTDGTSWDKAWSELDRINWNVIKPGDKILIDGGVKQMVYESALKIKKSGTRWKPITIEVSDDSRRNGKVMIFGGRSIPLPYTNQKKYKYQTKGVRKIGIDVGNNNWIVIDGMKWSGITIHGHNRYGVYLSSKSNNILVRNVEIYDNGKAFLGYFKRGAAYPDKKNGKWQSFLPGIYMSGSNNTVERAIIHDNGEDALQADTRVNNFNLRESWLYNKRIHPKKKYRSFNYGPHPDGMQIFDGGVMSGVLIEDCVIGPGLGQGILLGGPPVESEVQSLGGAVVNDVVVRNTLFYDCGNCILTHSTEPENWTIENVTTVARWTCVGIRGKDHTVKDSILYGGRIRAGENPTVSGNYQWDFRGSTIGVITNPMFKKVVEERFSFDGDYSLKKDSPCHGKGSRITSIKALLTR